MIPQESIQLVLDTAKIEDVVGDFIPLKRRGVNLIGLCPFHGEKTPSFNVSPVRNIFKCFGCGVGGNAINFIMQHENTSYPEAIRFLAKKYNIELREETPSQEYIDQQVVADALYIINDFAAKYYQEQMWDTEYGQNVALSYFLERGIREETIRKFGLGFALGNQNDLVNTMVSQKYDADLIRQAGLTNSYGKDFFKMRVMFPIHSVAGKVIGFGGRVMGGADKNMPKYINTPESAIYNKSKSLYGIALAKKAIAKENVCYLVEGYMDVIALHQSGIENVVASSGTSLTPGQIQLIKRYTNNITILYDGDAAGIKAALRGMDLVLEQDMDVKLVTFPEGEDPDSYIRRVGETAFRTYIKEKAKDFILFKTDFLLKDTKQDPIARAHALQEIVLTLAKIQAPLKRDIYIRECAHLFEIDERILNQEINKQISNNFKKQQQQNQLEANMANKQQELLQNKQEPNSLSQENTAIGNQTTDDNNISTSLVDVFQNAHQVAQPSWSKSLAQGYQEKDIVRLLILFGHLEFENQISIAEHILVTIKDLIAEIDEPIYKQIIEIYLNHLTSENTSGVLDTDFFVNHPNPSVQHMAIELIAESEQYVFSENWKKYNVRLSTQGMPNENYVKDVKYGLGRFMLKKIERLAQKNQQAMKELQANTEANFDDLRILLFTQQKIVEMRNQIAKDLNTVVLK